MSNVAVKKNEGEPDKPPAFADIVQRFNDIRRRAYELFERRGSSTPGQDLDDWFKAEREVLGWPAAELTENGTYYEIQLALPGFEAKDVEVTATPEEVIVRAKAEHEKKSEEDKVVWTEFGSNEVFRRVMLPSPVAVDEITAKLDKGVLKVRAPKPVAAKEPAKEAEKKVVEEKVMAASAA